MERNNQTYNMKNANPTSALLSLQPSPHFPAEFQTATATKAENQRTAYTPSTVAKAMGFPNFLDRGKRGVIVWYINAGIVRKTCRASSASLCEFRRQHQHTNPKYHPGRPSTFASFERKTAIMMIQAVNMMTA